MRVLRNWQKKREPGFDSKGINFRDGGSVPSERMAEAGAAALAGEALRGAGGPGQADSTSGERTRTNLLRNG